MTEPTRSETPAQYHIRRYNRAAQRNSAAALAIHLASQPNGPAPPDEMSLLDLHRVGMLFLSPLAGCYRQGRIRVRDRDDATVHQPPDWREIPGLMQDFLRDLQRRWNEEDAISIAAFALWRIGYVHPFTDGNGRAATAFAYACLCAKLGAPLDGDHTILDQISAAPDDLNAILADINAGLAATGEPDLSALRAYLDCLLLAQIEAAQAQHAGAASKQS
jgi:fido (protein-threonine AMPylation protein)